MNKAHTFHIPVMGIGFTIDTPIKVAHLGIDSVIFISDDILLEKMRRMYSERYGLVYKSISDKSHDYRAKRVTAYLDLIHELVKLKFNRIKNFTGDNFNEVDKYFQLLPNSSDLKLSFQQMVDQNVSPKKISQWLSENLYMGSIDVNIMTKLDRENYKKKEKLSAEFNDAHAALRGYAKSTLSSSIVFSAGMNPRLFGYAEQFDDFYPNEKGEIRKKIVLKVSDYRSALIQGKFLAKKGLWVSEYRIESGLNCGGHAFATEGFLMGPILEQFKEKKEELIKSVQEVLVSALEGKNKTIPKGNLNLKVTAQGGVGTAEEHQFLLSHYEVDSVGWGTPFLLVPEATSVDEGTMNKLMSAKEKDLYLSHISPLGVPFNNLRGNTKDIEKLNFIAKGRPGSACPKKFLALVKNGEEEPICRASRQFQHLKLKELDSMDLTIEEHKKRYQQIVEPSCLCVGLGTSALIVNDIDRKVEGDAVLICPGPNMAYFSKKLTLNEMTNHIYGRQNVIDRLDRPNMFIKELVLYIDYLKKKIETFGDEISPKDQKYVANFSNNLKEGIQYYMSLFGKSENMDKERQKLIIRAFEECRIRLNSLEFLTLAS
ncbi:MAG: hypothetical protein JXR07_02900 [Reichenbachiella sp.]